MGLCGALFNERTQIGNILFKIDISPYSEFQKNVIVPELLKLSYQLLIRILSTTELFSLVLAHHFSGH